MRETDENGDWITDRGFRHTEIISSVPGYTGTITVYESSAAAAPRVWIQAMDDHDDVVVHLEVEDARRFAENILRVCDLHYQL